MNNFQKYGIIGLAFTLLLPIFLNYSHVFAHEFEFGCDNLSTSHLHQSTLDCDLCKFHPTPIIEIELCEFEIYETPLNNGSFSNHYDFLSDFQKLSFQLRGPPLS